LRPLRIFALPAKVFCLNGTNPNGIPLKSLLHERTPSLAFRNVNGDQENCFGLPDNET